MKKTGIKMANQKYQKQLNKFIQSKTIGQSDFVKYIKMLNDLTTLLNKDNGYDVYAGVVKNWITGFKTIFSEDKITQNEQSFLEAIMNRFCPDITNIFFKLLLCFRQFESHFIQEFYIHWKTFLSRIDGRKRAECFHTNASKFKIVIQNLRTATSRTEQFAILAVLRLYIECLPINELYRLRQDDNSEIVKGLARFMQNPTILNQHEFLNKINALGHSIETLNPQRIICTNINIDMDITNHEMWLDFNKTERSVVFATVSKADWSKQSIGTAARRVKIRESERNDHLLVISGIWNVMSADSDEVTEEKVVFKFYFLDKTEQLISKAMKHSFRFVNLGGSNGSLLQGLTDTSDAQHEADGSEQAPHRLGSLPSVIRPKLTSLQSKFSLPTPPKLSQDVGRFNSSLSRFYRTRNELDEQDAELPTQLTYVIKPSITTFAGQSNSDDSNAMYVLRESVNPIAAVQSENDSESQKSNYDIVDMDIESQSSELMNAYGNLSSISNRTYTIIDDGQSDATYLVDRLTYYESAIETNSKLLYRDDTLLGGNDEVNDLENENANDGESRAYSGKKIEILENITIVPPYEPSQFATAEEESIEPERYSACMTDIPRTYLSQADERVSVKRVFNQYSQPATPREWLHVKVSSIQSRNVVIIGSNKSRQSLQQSREEVTPQEINSDKRDDQLNRSLNQDDLVPNVSQKETPQSQAASSCPSQYDSFVPIVMSSQRSQQQALQDSQKERSMQSSQKTEYQNSKTLVGSCQDRGSTETSQKMSSQNLSQSATRRTKCIAIADLPKMSQPVGPISKSRKEPKSSQKAPTKASQKSSEETTSLSLQHRIKVPITDQHDKSSKMNRIKSPETPTPLASALPNKESVKELNAPLKLESTANSSQKQATTPHQQLIRSASIISPSNDDVESPPSAKRVKSEFTSEQPSQTTQIPETVPSETDPQNAIQEQSSFTDAQPFDDDDSFMDVPQNSTENPESPIKPATKTFFQRKINGSDNSKLSAEITMPNGAAPRKLANNWIKSKRRLTNETTALLYRNVSKNMATAKAKQSLNEVTKVVPRYSALNSLNPATRINQNNSDNRRSNEVGKRDQYDDELAAIVEDSSNGKTTLNDYVPSDDISVDENGTVFDDKGCVFGDNDELQRAACFYIANDGLNYLKADAVAKLPTRKRQRYERQLKTIQRMIDHGLEQLHATDVKPKKPKNVDPYALSSTETTIQGTKPKRQIKTVSVTMSRKTIGNKTKKITMTKSKLYYDNDVPTFSKPTKSKSKTENFFWKTKPHTASVTVSIGRTKSGSKKLPATTSYRAVDDQSSSNFGFDETVCPEEISLPIYASQKMIDSHGKKSAKRDPPAVPRRDKSPPANSSSNDPVLINDGKPDQGLCSTATCASNMKELLDHLNGIEMKSGRDFQELCEQNKIALKSFIDCLNQEESQRDHGNSNWQELLNRLLKSMESMCDTVCAQLQEQQQRDKEQMEWN